MSYEMHKATGGDGLADVLERILDKGVVIAGDVTISLVGIELLTIRLRLLIATVDKAKEIGIDWWESDPRLSARSSQLEEENAQLLERIDRMERRLFELQGARPSLT
ncbi:MAG: gas vesicle protein [Pseudomonadota bacterium]